MKVVWSAWALGRLDEINAWYCQEASAEVADGTVAEVLAMAQLLAQFPFGGQKEPWLSHLKLGHRRMIVGHIKLVYRVEGEEVRIVDVFDSRQDPGKMKG